jgi:excisionase family DNA binding protein
MARPVAKSLLTLTETAHHLGVHYMTAYKYVRTGRLPAHKVGQEWYVASADLATFTRSQEAPARRGARRAAYPAELQDRFLQADEAGAWSVVERALGSGMDPDEILLDLLSPAMAAVGDDWERGIITVAQEHQASAIATRVVGRLGPQFARRGRKRGHVVVGAAPLDEHGLPSAILRDLLQGRRLAVTDLGANVPAESWESTVVAAKDASPRLVGVGICATTKGNQREIKKAIAAIREVTTVPIVLGGHGVASAAQAMRLGADRYSASAAEAVALLDAIVAPT